MKTLALLAVLALHSTGLWPHISQHARTGLTNTASNSPGTIASTSAAALTPVALPVPISSRPLKLNAASAYAIDTTTGTVLFSQDPRTTRPIASISKIMTTLVLLSRHKLDEPLTIPELPPYQPADETIGLHSGETYTTGDLTQAALINSGNDAADAIALIDAGSTPRFTARMNDKLKEWGIADAHFTSPSGLQDAGNYASAEALAKIAQLALTNPFIRETVSKQSATITSSTGRSLYLQTTDDLLATGRFYGIKTGYTPAAGECFVGLTRINGHEVITVVLGADDRFGATQTLANWIESSYLWL